MTDKDFIEQLHSLLAEELADIKYGLQKIECIMLQDRLILEKKRYESLKQKLKELERGY